MRLCPYHEDSLGWDACTEEFAGCEADRARNVMVAAGGGVMANIGYGNRAVVTAENIEDLKSCGVPRDQADELAIGCETWGIMFSGGQRGQITVWPVNGRAAVEFGGMSEWGDWDAQHLVIRTDDGPTYDVDGTEVTEERREPQGGER